MEIMRLIILGAGMFAQEVTDLVEDIPGTEVVAYAVDSVPFMPGQSLLGRPVYWVDELPSMLGRGLHVLGAIASTRRANFVQKVDAMGFPFATIIHPTARVSRTAIVGSGSLISSGAQVAAYGVIGRHVILIRGALVGHHANIGDFCSIGPGANLAGSIRFGARVFVGMGANVLEKVEVGDRAVIGAGALVHRDVTAGVKVIGSPAVVVEKDIEGQ